MTTSNIP
jgi:hypothetical protein